jgi:tetratricopeptide (TPR) repeat protein
VCHAVQHAHQKGIIHRDLKPSNILVEVHDVRPVVKIIDFGIAKAIGQQLTDKTMYTAMAHMVGTPMYMSPEQAGLSSLDVDTRSDVYSLGVLLYELLAGTSPFESDTLKKAGYDEMRRIIREEEPPKPSTRLSTLQEAALSTIAERRGLEAGKLAPELRRELDWVVMKAMEKDRNRRYESASALAADVLRYLSDEPVQACPPSAGYRLRKFWRRNRRLLVTAGVFVALLTTATAVSSWQAVNARIAQRRAEAAESQAATEAAIAQAVNAFLQEDLLGQVTRGPTDWESGGNQPLTVKEALDRAAARIGQRFQDQPLVEAAIRRTIGEAYGGLELNQLALPHLERAIALQEAHLSPDHPDTLASVRALANVYSTTCRHPEAIDLHRRILGIREAQLGPQHPETLACLRRLGWDYLNNRQYDKSAQLFEQVLEKQRSVCGPTHPDTLATIHILARNYEYMGRLAESMALHEEGLNGLRSTNGPQHGSTIGAMMAYAQACQRAGVLDRAEQLLREALALNEKNGNPPRQQRSNALGWLALTMHLKGRDAEAESLIRETLAFHEKVAPDHPRTCYWRSVLGVILLGQRRDAEAGPLILKGYQGMKERETEYAGYELERAEAGERVVRFYELTNHPGEGRRWRERLLEDKSKK